MAAIDNERSTKNIKGWEGTFPGVPEGNASAPFMKRVVYALASDFMRHRNFLPVDSFKTRRVDFLKIHVLDMKTPVASRLNTSLLAALGALDLKYLKEIHLIVTQSKDPTVDEALEVITFRITYPEDIDQSSDIAYHGVAQLRHQIAQVVQRIHVLARSIERLPNDCFTHLKLTYYEQRTPQSFEPTGFVADEKYFRFSQPAEKILVGRINCELHTCEVMFRSVFVNDAAMVKSHVDNFFLNATEAGDDSSLMNGSQRADGMPWQSSMSSGPSFCQAMRTCAVDRDLQNNTRAGVDKESEQSMEH